MSSFKDILNNDMATFFSLDEFSTIHRIDGKKINIVIDENRLMERNQKNFQGLSVGEILYFVKADDFGELPEQGTPQNFDGKRMYVLDAKEDNGIYEIMLQQDRGE